MLSGMSVKRANTTPGDDVVGFDSASYDAVDSRTSPDDALAGFESDPDGTIDQLDSNNPQSNMGSWFTSVSDPDDYELMMQYDSGDHLNGIGSLNEDQWYQGGTTRGWWMEVTGLGDLTFNGTWRIRPNGGGGDIDTAAVTMNSVVEA